jgi:hypothetical protein
MKNKPYKRMFVEDNLKPSRKEEAVERFYEVKAQAFSRLSLICFKIAIILLVISLIAVLFNNDINKFFLRWAWAFIFLQIVSVIAQGIIIKKLTNIYKNRIEKIQMIKLKRRLEILEEKAKFLELKRGKHGKSRGKHKRI